MNTANWFNVFDSDASEWLTDDGKWSKSYSDAKEFETWGSAVAEAKASDPKGKRTATVLGDFGNAHDA